MISSQRWIVQAPVHQVIARCISVPEDGNMQLELSRLSFLLSGVLVQYVLVATVTTYYNPWELRTKITGVLTKVLFHRHGLKCF